MYRHDNRFEFEIGDLVEVYSPLSVHHGCFGLIIDGPNVYGVYTVLIQEDMKKRNFASGEMERIN